MKTNKDMISIIIPAYNREAFMEECIASVLAQSYQDFEIVIVDDGSSDNTYEICKELAIKEPRIKLFASEHIGVSAARNIALEEASGEYTFFLDSDDVIYPRLLETLVSGLKNSDASMAGTSVVSVSEKNWDKVRAKLREESAVGEMTYRTYEEALYAIFNYNSPLACIGGVMMRRDFIGDTRFCTDLFIAEDYYFIYENLIKGTNCIFLNQRWYYARHHANNSSWNYSYEAFWSRFYLRKLVWLSEEFYGRSKYSTLKKIDAFGRFMVCFQKNKPYSEDSRKMRNVMKEHRKDIFPALSLKARCLYILSLYLPATAQLLLKLKKKADNIARKRKK